MCILLFGNIFYTNKQKFKSYITNLNDGAFVYG